MRYKKRRLFGFLLGGWMIIWMAGCGERWEESELEAGIRNEIGAVLPQGEAIDEMEIIEKEKTRDAIRYYVYCRMGMGDGQTIREKCYLVTYRRRNGEWVCEEGKGVQLLEETVEKAK